MDLLIDKRGISDVGKSDRRPNLDEIRSDANLVQAGYARDIHQAVGTGRTLQSAFADLRQNIGATSDDASCSSVALQDLDGFVDREGKQILSAL